ncbi:MAG: hypothetical protein HY901_17460 [Deltaproteobacteria bacterium]|nr:hypothetical protein [Deltaproteobacteria bacterium]
MPEIDSKRFAKLFQRALAKGGSVAEADVSKLQDARRQITNAKEGAAADGLLSMLRHDCELDSFEVAPARKALGVLLGVSKGPLPVDLEKVLAGAVPQANVRVKHYDLAFDLSKDGAAFPARAIIHLERKAPQEAVLEANASRLHIGQVLVDGKPAPFEVRDNRVHVFAPGAKRLDIGYTIKPTTPGDSSYGLIHDKYSGRMWTMTWPYNTGALFPSNSAPADGATSSVTVKVADGKQVVAGGDLENGAFQLKANSPAYGIAFYVDPSFERCSPSSSAGAVEVSGFGAAGEGISADVRAGYLETARKAVDFYSQWLGRYEYGDSLRLVEISGGMGGMEHTGAVAIMTSTALSESYSKETAAHEVAHHWFGDNLRIKDWGDFWMSEGFTTYATHRFFKATDGDSRWCELWDRAKGEVQSALQYSPHALSAPAHTDVNEIFDSISYEMGGWMMRMIEAQLGTPEFDELIKGWYSKNKGKAVSTEGFIAFAKQTTGRDLAPFFKDWGHITAVPSFKADVTSRGSSVKVALRAQTPVPDGVLLPLRIEGEGGKTKTVMVDPAQPLTVDAGFEVTGWTWDPERTVLAYVD